MQQPSTAGDVIVVADVCDVIPLESVLRGLSRGELILRAKAQLSPRQARHSAVAVLLVSYWVNNYFIVYVSNSCICETAVSMYICTVGICTLEMDLHDPSCGELIFHICHIWVNEHNLFVCLLTHSFIYSFIHSFIQIYIQSYI